MLTREAIGALRRHDPLLAQSKLDLLVAGAADYPIPWTLIAQAAEARKDGDAAEAALSRQLAIDNRDLAALLMMAASRARRGDDRAAQAFYRTAFQVAVQPKSNITPALAAMLRTGEAFVAQSDCRFAAHVEQAIASLEIGGRAPAARLRHALDLLFGRSELHLQQPSMFYFPGLPQRPFFERGEFAWVADLEAAAPAIREEVLTILADGAGLEPYVERTIDRPAPANHLMNDPRWSAFHIWRTGQLVMPNAHLCPNTVAALQRLPMPIIENRSPMALFSVLRPGTHIRPHNGLLNTRLICHLPIIAPQDCGLRVGAETRNWHDSECLIFDDSIEHEAWNHSNQTRVVLLFEVWRPELDEPERTALATIFEAIDSYRGPQQDGH